MADQFIVVSSNTNDRRTFYSGSESDCKTWVQNNYPRPHVEPGSNAKVIPDVYVESPSGDRAGYDGTTWSDENDEPVAADVDTADDGSSEPADESTSTRPSPNGGE